MAKMPAQKPGRSKQDYETPQEFLAAVRNLIGIDSFVHDFACSRQNKKATYGWTERDNSLSKSPLDWTLACHDGWGWLNPPYANITPWTAACVAAMDEGAAIAFLVPASVGSNWYRDYIDRRDGIRVLFCNPRLSFDGTAPYPKDCMVVLFNGHRPWVPFRTEVWTWK